MNKIVTFCKNEERFYVSLGKILIISFAIIMGLLATLTKSFPVGESDDYMIATLTLENHFSLDIRESDIEAARVDFPSHYNTIKHSYTSGGFPTNKNGVQYPWYMGTYSLACIPMKQLLKALHLNQEYAFQLTNVLFYVLTLLLVFYKLNASAKEKFIIMLLLATSPIIVYYFWASAEMFIFSLVSMAIVFWHNKNYKIAALLIGILGTLNPTIMAMGFAIIIDFFIELYKKEKNLKIGIVRIFLKNFKEIVFFGSCFLPFFSSYILNYMHFEMFHTQTMLGLSQTKDWGYRFLSYLFDLNLGLLPYMPIVLIFFIMFTLYGIIWKRNSKSFVFLLGWTLIISAFSMVYHINCGMSGLARYNTWVVPIMIFYLVLYSKDIIKRTSVKRIINICLLISAIYTFSYLYVSALSEHKFHPQYFSPIAEKVLDEFPNLYNPFHYTFISRTEHIDGGYWTKEYPGRKDYVVYSNRMGEIRKILLLEPINFNEIREYVVGLEKDLNYLEEEFKKIDANKEFQYINVPRNIKLVYTKGMYSEFDPIKYKDLYSASKGIYWNEGDFHWLSPDATVNIINEKAKEKGLHIKYGVMGALFQYNNLEEYKIDIYINDRFVKSIPLTMQGSFEDYIKAEYIQDDLGILKIRFVTNASFNPSQMGYADSRNLAIMLQYVGVPE